MTPKKEKPDVLTDIFKNGNCNYYVVGQRICDIDTGKELASIHSVSGKISVLGNSGDSDVIGYCSPKGEFYLCDAWQDINREYVGCVTGEGILLDAKNSEIRDNNADDLGRGLDSIEVTGECCFVATAVYGDSHAPQVESLRGFRDSVLAESSFGQKLIDLYYGGAGQRTAEFIKKHLPSTIPAIRKGLDVIVQRYESKK